MAPTMRSRAGTFHAFLGELSYHLAHRFAKRFRGEPVLSLRHLAAQFLLQNRVLYNPSNSLRGIFHGTKSQPGVASDDLHLPPRIVYERNASGALQFGRSNPEMFL